MIKTSYNIENLIIKELEILRYKSFTAKEYNIMFNNIKNEFDITENEFHEGIISLIDKNLLYYKVADSGIKYYQLSDKLKQLLNIN